jgi:predicted amidophosphoribosyltransferase
VLIQPASAAPGICRVCRLPIDTEIPLCIACANQPNRLDAILPITYAARGGPVYRLLREYKNARVLERGTSAAIWVAGILWRFLDSHEACLANAARAERFDFVTTVPSGDPDRDARRANLRAIAASCAPISDRYHVLLRPTGRVRWGRAYDPQRYDALDGRRILRRSILLIDDLWVTGGHAQSAAYALRQAGAATVALLVVGRYLRADWPAGAGTNCGDRIASLATGFDWGSCAAESLSVGATEPA